MPDPYFTMPMYLWLHVAHEYREIGQRETHREREMGVVPYSLPFFSPLFYLVSALSVREDLLLLVLSEGMPTDRQEDILLSVHISASFLLELLFAHFVFVSSLSLV